MGDIESNQFGDPEMGCAIEAEVPEQPKSENSSDFDSGIDFDILVEFFLT